MDRILREVDAHLLAMNAIPEGLNDLGLIEGLDVCSDFHETGRITIQGFRLVLSKGEEITNLFT